MESASSLGCSMIGVQLLGSLSPRFSEIALEKEDIEAMLERVIAEDPAIPSLMSIQMRI